MGVKVVATNRKAHFEYFLIEHFEAGIALQGSEIKSIRAGQMSLAEAFVRIDEVGREAWLMNAHIAPYDPASRYNHEPLRPRRLLLHKSEIREMWDAVRQKGNLLPERIADAVRSPAGQLTGPHLLSSPGGGGREHCNRLRSCPFRAPTWG